MKRCPFLVAGLSMQTAEPRPGVIPITSSAEEQPVVSSAECLGAVCRFFHAGGCRFDSLFEAQSQLQSAAAVVQAGSEGGVSALSSDAATVLAALPSTLEEVWSLQRESLREVMGGFRALESAQVTLQSGVATQVEAQVGQVQVRVQSVGTQVGQVEASIARLEALVEAVQTHVQKFDAQFGGVGAAVARVQQDVAGVQAGVEQVQQDVTVVRDQVVQVETQVRTVAETKPSIGPEILDLVGRHFETLERDMRQIEASVRAGLGDSLRAFVKESQTAAVAGAETSVRAILEGVQAALRTSSQESAAALHGLLHDSQEALRISLEESQQAMRAVQGTHQTLQSTVQESQAALRGAMADSQTAMRTVILESQAAIGTAALQSQAAVREALSGWQPNLDLLVSRSSDETRIQVEQALAQLVDELAAARDVRLQLQASLDGLTREAREVATVARRVESTQVLTHELLDEQRQVHQIVEARENRERARQLNNAGVLSYHQGAYDASVQRFREAAELDPTLSEAYNNLGLSYTEMGREEEAVVAFQRAIELDPGSGQVYNNLGYLYYRKGDLTQAIEMYQRAIQRGSDTGSAYCNLGNAYYRLRRVDQAVQAWRRALEVDPANSKAAAALERLGMEARPT